MNAINGIGEKGSSVFSQVLRSPIKTLALNLGTEQNRPEGAGLEGEDDDAAREQARAEPTSSQSCDSTEHDKHTNG